MVTVKQILSKLASKRLNLHRGNGYQYFVYDDPAHNIYKERTINVNRLNDLSLDQWVQEGRDFLDHVEGN